MFEYELAMFVPVSSVVSEAEEDYSGNLDDIFNKIAIRQEIK